ncbi:hypothetical protein NQ317_019166 [Molorchus minor]|uniref:Uncharacterized protein n=1 Tax=Molorchus minor TaxID=1323400 RepID=A0ABQ9JAN1_9CUCU|nr:hypothetical protein NQ317_019166 [Molorchus minor]
MVNDNIDNIHKINTGLVFSMAEGGIPLNKEHKMQFTGKVILITGASSGIGAATAKHFAKLGASLALTGRNLDNLKQTVPLVLTGELTNEGDTKAILDKTVEHFGRLDVLVNNAGTLESGSIENTSLEQYDRVMNTNCKWYESFPGVLAYCVSKAAVDQFTRCVALDLASKQVRVNSKAQETHALGRPGRPEEVAQTIAFLASDDASFITGASMTDDGEGPTL